MKKNQSDIDIYYFDNPQIYEDVLLARGDLNSEIDFLLSLFHKHEVRTVLDVGCGPGTHLNRLQTHGIKGVGLDKNRNMLAFAKKKYKDIPFLHGDMCTFKTDNPFDAITCLCTTFSWNLTNDTIRSALSCFYHNLRERGLLIIDTFNPIMFINKKQFMINITKSKPYDKYGLICNLSHEIDEKEQLMIEHRTIKKLETEEIIKSDTLKYRMFFPKEIAFMFESCGFKVLDQCYDFQKTLTNQYRLITIGQKK